MALPASDTFAGTGALSASWTNAVNSLTRVGGIAEVGTDGVDCYAFWNADTFPNDQKSSVVLGGTETAGSNWFGATVRASGTGASHQCYVVYTDGSTGAGHFEVAKYVGGTYTVLANFGTTLAIGDTLELRVAGTSLSVWKNGVQVGSSVTDSGIASGSAGMYAFHSATSAAMGNDSWTGDSNSSSTSKTDTDTDTLTESATALTNITVGQGDSATLTEGVPQISPTAQADSFTFSETQTVTPSGGTTSKTDTDAATLTETAPGPLLRTGDSATVTESAVTLIVTDVQTVPDFTLSEQTPQITLAVADSLSFTEQQTLTASFIRFVDSDAFGLVDAGTSFATLNQTDGLSAAELVNDLIARVSHADTGSVSETQTVVSSAPTTGYLLATLSVSSRLEGTIAATARLQGATGARSRLTGAVTVQPAGRP